MRPGSARSLPRIVALLAIGIVSAIPSGARAATPQVRLKIESQPPGASIYVDGKENGVKGITPTTIKVPKGTHMIRLELDGYKPSERQLTIDRAQGFVFQLEKMAKPAILDVRSASDGSATGADIVVDGTKVGTVPNRVEVAAGNHLLEVNKPSFQGYRDTIPLAEGETRTLVIPLLALVKPGQILITADVPGAEVFVDGQDKGVSPTLVDNVSEGAHAVEVRKEGAKTFAQTVAVQGGGTTKVFATLAPTAPVGGTLKILCSAPGAEVFVDGDDKGPPGTVIQGLAPGSHIVELRAQGFEPKRQSVETPAGQATVVAIDLVAAAPTKQVATLRVISAVPEAQVFIDGADAGKAPVDKNDLAPGPHIVVVHKDGYADYKADVTLTAGQTTQVVADVKSSGAIKAFANLPGADIFLDGVPTGKKTPADLPDVSAGVHIVEMKAPGYVDARVQVTVAAGGVTPVEGALSPVSAGPQPADVALSVREQSSWGATVIDRLHFNADLGFGDPSFVTLRLVSGIFRSGAFGADIAVELRSNWYQTDIGIRPRFQLWRMDPVAVAINTTIMGGGGPNSRNEFTWEVGPIVSLLAGSYVRFSFQPYLQVTSDRLCPSVDDIKSDDVSSGNVDSSGMPIPGSGDLYKSGAGEEQICKAYDEMRGATGYDLSMAATSYFKNGLPKFNTLGQDPRERFVTTRFFLQAVLEVMATQNLNLWLLVEGAPGQGGRPAYLSKFNPAFTDTDFPLYVRFGASVKF